MRSGFRPRDRDRMTDSIEGSLLGFWATLEGCWAAKREGLYGYPVNHWSTKRPPNGTKLDRRSTGAIPRPLGKTRSIPRTFNTHSQLETKGERRRT